ncbi:MAG TPA: 2-C-methyl-D-erythritol 4-phosphate cytidylyltransferase [Verrucomicrobiae bacterium]|jgi:2-C-methyl-D-erythritol 4-phosphate cytidylyltransferase|nr:2-C-methyl-D-erythritol 4-phosphate cytidylyltransferase [Verrucomicrobiae bacterium]
MDTKLVWGAVIVAAGRGTRLGRAKQLLDVAGVPLVGWCMRTFAGIAEIGDVAIVAELEAIEPMRALAASIFETTPFVVVAGGATRQESVSNGINALSERCTAILVHDGARPLVRASDVLAGMAEVRPGRGAILAAPMSDTIKVVDATTMTVLRTLDRQTLWAAQTPQFATRADLRRAHAEARKHAILATDEAALLERLGCEVAVVASSGDNIKVTQLGDLARVQSQLSERLEHGHTEEEVMLVEVFVDATLVDAICVELESRGGRIDSVERDLPSGAAVRAYVAGSAMRGFGDCFEAFGDGRATFTAHFSHYAGRGERDSGGLR